VQGITGREGQYHAQRMQEYGHNVVAGTSPGHGGEWVLNGKVPVFDTVEEAKKSTGADTSVIFVPAYFAYDAILESIENEIGLIICISEGIPIKDMLKVRRILSDKECTLIGPNSPGILTPGQQKLGLFRGILLFRARSALSPALEPSLTKWRWHSNALALA